MFRFRFHRSALVRWVLVLAWWLFPPLAMAGLCEKDSDCLEAAKRADRAMTSEQRRDSIRELREQSNRIVDPRLLAILGRLYQKEGQHHEALEFCEQAKVRAPGDLDVQQKATECLEKAHASIAPPPSKSVASIVKRVDAKGGNANAAVTLISDVKQNTVVNVTTPQPIIQITNTMTPSSAVMPAERPSLLTRWWLWTGIAVVVTAGAIGAGIWAVGREPDISGFDRYRIGLVTR